MDAPITLEEFKEYFSHDFDFSKVRETDINFAYEEAKGLVAYSLKTSSNYKLAFCYLTAHYLFNRVGDGKGGTAQLGTGILNSESMDDLSKSYSIPEKFLKEPKYYFFMNSKFGLKYLNYLINCNKQFVGLVGGRTQPD